jgi:hypothetical protein
MPHSVAPINAAVNNKATVREEHKERGKRGKGKGKKDNHIVKLTLKLRTKNPLFFFVIFSFFVLFVCNFRD